MMGERRVMQEALFYGFSRIAAVYWVAFARRNSFFAPCRQIVGEYELRPH
jgi:hypothetical protein